MATKRKSNLFQPVKGNKGHFTKWLQRMNGAWLSKDVPVVNTVNQIANEAKNSTDGKFQSHYPDQLALAYGIKNNLVHFKPNKDDERYTTVFLTPKGYQIVIDLQERTCAFTGRTVR